MDKSPVILVEFNELCPSLIDRWIATNDLPNFRSLRESSTVCVTRADEQSQPFLEPWIQWYSLHTGIPFSEHGVFRLSEGANQPYQSVWDILIANGRRVMSFSSMNCRGFQKDGSIFLPDPWNDDQQAYPKELEVFRQFLSKSVQEQANGRWTAAEVLRLTNFLLSNGLRVATVIAGIRQLIGEKASSTPSRWRRVRILDEILLDVFLNLYRKNRPEFATFFSNSTAHLQHAYWRYLEPEKFVEPTTPSEQAEYSGAVKFGYVSMDAQLGRIMNVAKSVGARIMFATALSQQAYLSYEGRGGRHYYRPKDIDGLLQRIGVRPTTIRPVMAHQFILSFGSEQERLHAEQALSRPAIDGKQVFDIADGETSTKMVFGAQIYSRLEADAQIVFGSADGLSSDLFFSHFAELEATKSGGHHPDGCFWMQTGRHREIGEKISILDVAPTILRHFGVAGERMRGSALTTS